MSVSKIQGFAAQAAVVAVGVMLAGYLIGKLRKDYPLVEQVHAGFDSGL